MLMCASLQSNASLLLGKFARKIQEVGVSDSVIKGWLDAVQSDKEVIGIRNSPKNRRQISQPSSIKTLVCIEQAFEICGTLNLIPPDFRSEATSRARRLVTKLSRPAMSPTDAQASHLSRYLKLTLLLIECLQISSVHNREEIEGLVLAV